MDWTALWKNEDWMSVWIGFIILIIFSTGASFKLPSWRWMADISFAEEAVGWSIKVQSLSEDAAKQGEAGLQLKAAELKVALDGKDRKISGGAAAGLQKAAKETKDKDMAKKADRLAAEIKGAAGASMGKVFSGDNLLQALYLLIGLGILGAAGLFLMGSSVGNFIKGFPLIFILSAISFFIAGNAGISYYGLEVVFWALLIGLAISNTVGVPEWLKTSVKTEFFIKIGLVLLGAEVLFTTIAKVGAFGIMQALIVICAVFYVCLWVARRLDLDDEFAAILGAAVSICGVSAAIAAGGAIKGDPKKVSHTISLVLLCAVPMLIIQPFIAKMVDMNPVVAGAWLGGTIDTTGAVVAAGSIAGEIAMAVAVVVKMAQNVLIGVAAFLLSLWFTFKGQAGKEKPSAREIWSRFPKFVLGFIVASLFFSFVMSDAAAKTVTGVTAGIRGWWFTLAFLCIGMETKFKELVSMGGGRPAAAFLIAQAFNIVWTLIIAYLIFGGILFPVQKF